MKLEELEERIEKLDDFVNSVPTYMKAMNDNLFVNVKDTVVQLKDKLDNELASTNRKIVEVADRYGDIDAKLEVFLMTQAYDSDDGDINDRLEGFLKDLNPVDTLKGKTKKKKKKKKVKFDSEFDLKLRDQQLHEERYDNG